MNITKRRNILIATIILTIAAVIIIITAGFAVSAADENPDRWVLRIHDNYVALFNGDNLDSVYSNIVIDTLPEDDIRQLENGIAFATKEEAVSAIEDYDG